MTTSDDFALSDRSWRILYGVNPVMEAARAGREIMRIWLLEGKESLRGRLQRAFRDRPLPQIHEVNAGKMQSVCRTGDHQGLAARVAALPGGSLRRTLAEKGPDLLVLLLDGVQDPHNLGAIYRVADASGVDLLFLPSKGSASHQLPSVAKASAGAVEHVPTVVVSKLATAVEELREHGFRILALEGGKAATGPREMDLHRPLALVVGGEDRGVSSTLTRSADGFLSLPMRGRVNSLNVSTATAVALYEILAQNDGRSQPDAEPDAEPDTEGGER